jgi:hypothetical protein
MTNINLNFVDTIIPTWDDPHGCLNMKALCCEFDFNEGKYKSTGVTAETCQPRIPLLNNQNNWIPQALFRFDLSSYFYSMLELSIRNCTI